MQHLSLPLKTLQCTGFVTKLLHILMQEYYQSNAPLMLCLHKKFRDLLIGSIQALSKSGQATIFIFTL